MEDNFGIDFRELDTDPNFKKKILDLHKGIDNVGSLLELLCEHNVYSRLNLEDKVKYDLFMSYSINSLFWLYLRTQGIDPAKHGIKQEIERVKNYNMKARQIQERRTLMPRIDKDAAERFVRRGLNMPREKEDITDSTKDKEL